MSIFATAGARVYIGTTAAIDFTTYASALAAFAADSYTQARLP